MTGKIRLVFVAVAVATGLVAATPPVLADEEVSLVAYVCDDLGTEAVRVDADGTIHIRGQTLLGESESSDARLDGLFRRRTNVDLYPDGSGVAWGVHEQRSHTYNGTWKLGFRVPFDSDGFLGTGSGAGARAFAGLGLSGTIAPAVDPGPSPCNPVIEISEFTGVITD